MLQNIKLNRQHYSSLARLGANGVSQATNGVGSGVYYNTLVPWKGHLIKYGVVATADLVCDCLSWRWLYLAGRLHKPVLHVSPAPASVQLAMQQNWRAAAMAALLLQQHHSIDWQSYLTKLCGLSYAGDIRMGLAEDTYKVARLAAGSQEQLTAIYAPIVKDLWSRAGSGSEDAVEAIRAAAVNPVLRSTAFASLPLFVHAHVLPPQLLPRHVASDIAHRMAQDHVEQTSDASRAGYTGGIQRPEAPLVPHAGVLLPQWVAYAPPALLPEIATFWRRTILEWSPPEMARALQHATQAIVARSSRRQAMLGLLSAGPIKSLRYIGRKVAKMLR